MSDDTELWSRSTRAGADAFAELFDRHRDRVYRHVSRLVETRADAEDLTAVAFLELWRKRRSVRLVDGSVLPWLLVTATNVTRNKTRSVRRYDALLARLPRDTDSADAADEAFRNDPWRDLDPALRSALHSLPVKDVQLIALVAFHELTIAEAANALAISQSAAKTRLSRARTKLKLRLANSQAGNQLIAMYGGIQ